ncbi:MAG TPA: DUF58 domain-containing protein [Geobacteraceae bacterium]
MATSGVFGWLNLRGLGVRVDLPDEVYCGVATLVTVRLANAKRLFPSFLLRIKFLGEGVPFSLVNRGGAAAGSFVHTFTERGRTAIPFAEISSPFPINFFVRSRRVPLDRSFPVFPAPLPCAAAGAAGKERGGDDLASPRKGFAGDVARIADYTGSEPMKLIHWRLSAKYDELKVKEMSEQAREPVIIDIERLPGANLEENLSCAAYLVNRLVRGNRPVGLKLRERVIPPALSREHRLGLLGELAIYGKD